MRDQNQTTGIDNGPSDQDEEVSVVEDGSEGRREREILEAVMQVLEDPLFLLDGDGEVTLANSAAEELMPHLGRSLRGPEACSQCRNFVARDLIEQQRCIDCLADFRRPILPCDVRILSRIYHLRCAELGGHGGLARERLFFARDVTRDRSQRKRQAHQERLAVVGEAAAVVAHELNNPLAAISMFSQMLLDELDADSPFRTHAEVVHRNTMSCKRTLLSLLELASAGQSGPETLDIRDVVSEVVELLGPLAQRKGVVLGAGDGVVDGTVFGNGSELKQAVINLVMNAIQAIETVGGHVLVEITDSEDELAVRVSDNGPGIPQDLRQRIFEPFFTTKARGSGTGLGLPTVRRIATVHGGRLVLSESSDSGATFELVLSRRLSSRPRIDEARPVGRPALDGEV